ncbi:MAG: hypothetical protein CL840_16855 [Crocinitomicaceae bacterium]|nr:hypothetical protein [Crocinitomicaceae bacterium]|tara:strand:+ start:1603 stop:2973 length:1371 start_codon:yes stop_codon:yes gene_type:complete
MAIQKKDIDLLSDQPISSVEEDEFGRKDFVNSIAEIIHSQATQVNPENKKGVKNIDENMIIGIYGEWGFGKSSILNMLKSNLENDRQLKTVYFNPWMYGSEDQIIISLFNVIIENCGLKGNEYSEFIKWMKKYYPLVSAVNATTGRFIEGVLKTFGDDTWSSNASYCKQQIDRILSSTANPLVIFIDDVDRLSKSEIQVLFKTLRLIASFKHVIYVIACDFNMVARSIKENYVDGSVEDGKSFVEKIIQIPIQIPQIHSDKLFEYAANYVEMTTDVNIRNGTIKGLFEHYFHTPRDVKRLINSYRFAQISIGDKLVPQDLFALELIRVKVHDLFEIVKIYYLATKSLSPDSFYNRGVRSYVNKNHPEFLKNGSSFDSENREVAVFDSVFRSLFGSGLATLAFKNIANPAGSSLPYRKHVEQNRHPNKLSLRNPENLKTYFEFVSNNNDVHDELNPS